MAFRMAKDCTSIDGESFLSSVDQGYKTVSKAGRGPFQRDIAHIEARKASLMGENSVEGHDAFRPYDDTVTSNHS